MRSVSFASGNEIGMLIVDRKTNKRAMELTGEELDEYCRNRGLCNRCVKVQTHKRVVKLFGKDAKWEPMTVRKQPVEASPSTAISKSKKDKSFEFSVYKGYCLKDHCYTIAEAKRLLGDQDSPKGRGFGKVRISLSKSLKRPNRRRMRTNPETGSVAGSIASFTSELSGISRNSRSSRASQMSNATKSSFISGLSQISGFSTHVRKNKRDKKKKKHRNSFDSWDVHSFNPKSTGTNDNNNPTKGESASTFDESEITIEDLDFSARTAPPNTDAGSNIYAGLSTTEGVSPMVAHRVEQLVSFDYFVVLYLSKADLSSKSGTANIDAICHALRNAQTLESITLENCKLDNEGIEKLAGGLEDHFNKTSGGNLKVLRLKGNRIGNRGVQALEFLFKSSKTLEELDLSENCIGSKGAASVLESLGANKVGIPLKMLNLAQNEIWDLSGNHPSKSSQRDNSTKSNDSSHHRSYSFLHTNSTLLELNLDGNCLHDEGAEFVADSLSLNRHNCVLKKLHLGYNGIGDSGTIALAKTLESNTSLRVLGLAENDITNTGARALLSALAVNVSMKEISGLYHNRIDRKFIIVAIKRLLHRGAADDQFESVDHRDKSDKSEASNPNIHMENVATTEETEGTESTTFSSSTSAEDVVQPVKRRNNRLSETTLNISTHSNGSLALEAIENWDWGTFGIEEIEQKSTADTESQIDQFLKDIEEEMSQDGDQPLVDGSHKSNAVSEPSANQKSQMPSDRLVVFQSAPLAYFDRKSMQHHGVPLLDFGYEAEAIRGIFADAGNKSVEVVFETATQNNFSNCFAKGWSPIMHFSCYGNSDCIALENGFGYMQALPNDAMKKIVSSARAAASSNQVEVVVISSCYADQLAEAFLNAGIPRVVALSRDQTSFRDEGPVAFAKGFYGALQQSKTLQEAFDVGIEESHKEQSSLLHSYKLLPEGGNHDVKIFFQNIPSPMARAVIPTDVIRDEDPLAILPKVPDQFFGREVDVYEILESLRVDDVIRIGGGKGSGKKSILSVLSRYILERSKSFQIDSVFWLPFPTGITPKSNSIYGDLCMVFQMIMSAEDDIWDDEDYKGARERILIEMEARNSILVIDGRVFTNEIAGEMLERFLTHLLNEVNVKIILITANDASRTKTNRSSSEETTVYLGPLDFRSTVKLYANACPLVASTDETNSTIDTVGEFEKYLMPAISGKKDKSDPNIPVVDSKMPERSRRQNDLYEAMGGGNPEEILRIATSCTSDSLSDLLKIAQRPEVSVSTSKELEEQMKKYTAVRDHAITSKYYLRANDIEKTLVELDDLKKVYPSLEDMKAKEADLKKSFSALLKAKRYDDANFVKRKILLLKRTMMKEKHSASSSSTESHKALDSINEIQERMRNMMALAESMNQSSTSVGSEHTVSEASFFVSKGCTLEISCGNLASFWKDSTKNAAAMVVWTNEACDLSANEEEMQRVLGDAVEAKLASMDARATTQWGEVKCATGDTIAVSTSGGRIILAVPPLMFQQKGTKKTDKENLWYTEKMLSSAIRSSFRKIRKDNNEDLVIGISTVSAESCKKDASEDYRLNRNLAVTLHAVVKELRRATYAGTAKTVVRLFASSGPAESLELIRIATEHGLPIAEA